MPGTASLLLAGVTAELAIAVPIGPMGLLCLQRSLNAGFAAGLATGLGGVTVNLLAAALLLSGLRGGLPVLPGNGHALGTASGLFLLWSAMRVLSRPPAREPAVLRPTAGGGLHRHYLSGLGLNACNPMSLVLVLAALSPVAGTVGTATHGVLLVLAGMLLAGAGWWACLSLGASTLRTRMRPAVLHTLNKVSGVLLGCYGALALMRACAP